MQISGCSNLVEPEALDYIAQARLEYSPMSEQSNRKSMRPNMCNHVSIGGFALKVAR